MEENTFQLISQVTEFNDISEHMQDEDLDLALDIIIKLIAKPDVPASKVAALIVQLQAMSVKFKMQAKYYMHFKKGTQFAAKKGTYMTASESIDKLVDALKYEARFGV